MGPPMLKFIFWHDNSIKSVIKKFYISRESRGSHFIGKGQAHFHNEENLGRFNK